MSTHQRTAAASRKRSSETPLAAHRGRGICVPIRTIVRCPANTSVICPPAASSVESRLRVSQSGHPRTRLPIMVLLHIFSFLPLSDIICCCAATRSMNFAAGKRGKPWRVDCPTEDPLVNTVNQRIGSVTDCLILCRSSVRCNVTALMVIEHIPNDVLKTLCERLGSLRTLALKLSSDGLPLLSTSLLRLPNGLHTLNLQIGLSDEAVVGHDSIDLTLEVPRARWERIQALLSAVCHIPQLMTLVVHLTASTPLGLFGADIPLLVLTPLANMHHVSSLTWRWAPSEVSTWHKRHIDIFRLMPSITHLDVSNGIWTDDQLVDLTVSPSTLRSIDLARTRLTPIMGACFARTPLLERLAAKGFTLNSDFLRTMVSLTDLDLHLDMAPNKIPDVIKNVASLRQLVSLRLHSRSHEAARYQLYSEHLQCMIAPLANLRSLTLTKMHLKTLDFLVKTRELHTLALIWCGPLPPSEVAHLILHLPRATELSLISIFSPNLTELELACLQPGTAMSDASRLSCLTMLQHEP
jgi:hypothetical protein